MDGPARIEINMKNFIMMIISAACLCLSPISFAQESTNETKPSETANISAANLEAAQRYMDAIEYEEQVKSTMITTSPQFVKLGLDLAEKQYNAPLSEEFRDQLNQVISQIIEEVGDDFATATRLKAATLFAKTFTAPELDRLTEIQSDPVMKKFLQLSPKIVPELVNIGIIEMQSFQPLIENRTLEAVQKYFDNNDLETN